MKQRVAIGIVLCVILTALPSAPAAAAGVPVNTTRPAVSGTAGVNGTLTTTKGSWTNSPTKYAYAWLRCASDGTACAVISGATKMTYLVVSADAGKRLESRVIASNASGPSAAAYSNLTTVVGYPPANLSVPTVSGSPVIGNTLAVGRGTWSQTPTAYAYRWRRCDSGGAACVTITGATSS